MTYLSCNTTISLALIFLLISGCSYTPTSPYLQKKPIIKSDEQAIADYVNRNIISNIPAYDSPSLEHYINTVGSSLEKKLGNSSLPIHYKLLDIEDVIAFCVFDGHIYLTTGLLMTLENEAELAAVIAHELGHIMSQSSRRERLFVKKQSESSKLLAGKITQDIGNDFFTTMDNVLAYGKQREGEYEADHFSIELMYLAGYHPSALSTLLEKLNLQQSTHDSNASLFGEYKKLIEVFATHPALPDRIKTADALVKKFGDLKQHVLKKNEFKKYADLLIEEKRL